MDSGSAFQDEIISAYTHATYNYLRFPQNDQESQSNVYPSRSIPIEETMQWREIPVQCGIRTSVVAPVGMVRPGCVLLCFGRKHPRTLPMDQNSTVGSEEVPVMLHYSILYQRACLHMPSSGPDGDIKSARDACVNVGWLACMADAQLAWSSATLTTVSCLCSCPHMQGLMSGTKYIPSTARKPSMDYKTFLFTAS